MHHDCFVNEIVLLTSVTERRYPYFKNDVFALEAIDVLYRVQDLHPFFLYGFVVMPDHIHLMMKVPEERSISKTMKFYKQGVSHSIGIGRLWQRGFHTRLVNDPAAALRYIHLNPMRAGLVEIPEDYPWSSTSGKWDVTDLPLYI